MTINHYLRTAPFRGGTIFCLREKKDKSSCIFSLFAKDREDFSLPD